MFTLVIYLIIDDLYGAISMYSVLECTKDDFLAQGLYCTIKCRGINKRRGSLSIMYFNLLAGLVVINALGLGD